MKLFTKRDDLEDDIETLQNALIILKRCDKDKFEACNIGEVLTDVITDKCRELKELTKELNETVGEEG